MRVRGRLRSPRPIPRLAGTRLSVAALTCALALVAGPVAARADSAGSSYDANGYGGQTATQDPGAWDNGSPGSWSGDGSDAGTPDAGPTDAWDPGSSDGTAIPSEPTPAPQRPTSHPRPVRAPTLPTLPAATVSVPGVRARLRANGKAAVPRGASARVRALIAAANLIVGKPYKWGGGHARLADSGYDCSGAVSYSLIRSGLLAAPLVSGALARWAVRGSGRWVSVYANATHVYLEVAGLRLDTSSVGDVTGRSGVRWRPVIGRRSGFAARHPAGL